MREIMFLLNKIKQVMFTCILITVIMPANAHVLKETSAQIILRDAQVEIKLITDIDHFIAALQNNQAWLMGDIDDVMPTGLSINQQQQFIKKALKQKTHLTINNKEINIERIVLANNNSGNDEIIFQARHRFNEVDELSISFHQGLGTIHINVVKPQYKLVAAGEKGIFNLNN